MLAPPAQPPGLRAGRALLILLAFVTAQVLAGIVVGVVGTVGYGTESSATASRAEHMQLTLAAILGVAAGGVAVWRLTWKSLRGPRREDALRSLGWSAASRRSVLVACLTGVVLAFILLFIVIPAFPPPPGYRWGSMARAASAGGWQRHLTTAPSRSCCTWPRLEVALSARPAKAYQIEDSSLSLTRIRWRERRCGAGRPPAPR